MSPNWAIDAALGYNRSSNDLGLAMMDGTFLSQRLSGAINLHGQYDLGFAGIRPRLSASYSRTFSDAYNLNGTVFRQAIGVLFPSADYDYGTLEGAVEINRMFTTSGGTRIMPYAEFGSVFEYTRPNGGQILTSDLQLATPSPWAFTVRSGVRMLLTQIRFSSRRVPAISASVRTASMSLRQGSTCRSQLTHSRPTPSRPPTPWTRYGVSRIQGVSG